MLDLKEEKENQGSNPMIILYSHHRLQPPKVGFLETLATVQAPYHPTKHPLQ
jgi:hypothetical protein